MMDINYVICPNADLDRSGCDGCPNETGECRPPDKDGQTDTLEEE